MARKKKEKPEGGKPPSLRRRALRLFFDLALCFVALTFVPVLVYRVIDPPTTPLMWIRWVESGNEESHPRFIRRWTPLKDVSPHLIRAVITAEDQKFFTHHGFDWVAVESAWEHNLKSKHKVGASTISMQTARNVFLWQERNWPRKALEFYFTFLIETFWSKERILEVYFNVIEWGDGVFGCTEAAQKYYKRRPAALSPTESAWLAAILPNPREWAQANPPRRVETRQSRILQAMNHVQIPRRT
jgi:monofunctional biosynthetic peptidoglycan transglycosylase